MSLANYADLKTGVANYLSRDDLASRVPEFIGLGEDRLYADLRVRFMETSADVVITSGVQTTTLPSGFLQARSVYLTTTPVQRVEYRAPIEFWQIYAKLPAGTPYTFTIEGEDFVWGPAPDANYTATVLYYARPADLVDDADTNGLFPLAPGLLLYASLIEAAPYLANDPRILTWSAMYDDLLEKIHMADRRDRASGDGMTSARAAQIT